MKDIIDNFNSDISDFFENLEDFTNVLNENVLKLDVDRWDEIRDKVSALSGLKDGLESDINDNYADMVAISDKYSGF